MQTVRQVRIKLSSRITQVEAVGGVLVLLPAYLSILILVVVLPVFVHVLLDVPPLPVFDPVVQLSVANVAVLISVNPVHNHPVERVMDNVY